MTARNETWKPIPGAADYEASDLGHIRSLDRERNGRFYRGVVLKPREDADGYLRVNITNDRGERQHNESVARLVLMAHDPEGYRPGLHACHGPNGRRDNRLTELRWDTPEANRVEALEVRLANNPPQPKPPKTCPRCGAQHRDRGRNCHPCVMKIGTDTTRMLVDEGMRLDRIQEELEYPAVGLINLAVIYGGLRFYREGYAPSPRRRSLSVFFRRGASRQNSDAG